MRRSMKVIKFRKNYALLAAAIFALGSSHLALASDGTIRVGTANREAQQVSLVVGKSTVVDVPVRRRPGADLAGFAGRSADCGCHRSQPKANIRNR
jgi:hypothetical protein